MFVYTLEQRWEILRQIDLQKMPILVKKIIFSEEAHFDLGGYVNKQNCPIWDTENPHAYIEKSMHPKRAVTVNGNRYRAMLNEFLFTKIEENDIDNTWFQQDGATCHTAEAILDVLRPSFCRSHYQPQSSCRCCDLTPLNNCLRDAVA